MNADPRCILHLTWVRQGKAQVEPWWIEVHGSATVPESSLEDHVSFANYDLQSAGLPKISQVGTTLIIRGVRSSQIQDVRETIQYHGFEITRIEDN